MWRSTAKFSGAVPGAQPTLIFPEGNVERPVEPVLNPPMVAHGLGKVGRIGREDS